MTPTPSVFEGLDFGKPLAGCEVFVEHFDDGGIKVTIRGNCNVGIVVGWDAAPKDRCAYLRVLCEEWIPSEDITALQRALTHAAYIADKINARLRELGLMEEKT